MLKIIIILTFFTFSCENYTETDTKNDVLTRNDVENYLTQSGFNLENVLYFDDYVVVEGDIGITHQSIKHEIKKKQSNRNKQFYEFNHLVDKDKVQNITIYVTDYYEFDADEDPTIPDIFYTSNFNNEWEEYKKALKVAVASLNSVHSDFYTTYGFQHDEIGNYIHLNGRKSDIHIEVIEDVDEDLDEMSSVEKIKAYNFNQHADIYLMRSIDYPASIMAKGNFPEAGVVGNKIDINYAALEKKEKFEDKVSLLKHEILHNFGFRHSNWNQNNLFSGKLNESKDGATRINNTPEFVNESIMIIGSGKDFTFFDQVAISELYPFTGEIYDVEGKAGSDNRLTASYSLSDHYVDMGDNYVVELQLYNTANVLLDKVSLKSASYAFISSNYTLTVGTSYYFKLVWKGIYNNNGFEQILSTGSEYKSSVFTAKANTVLVSTGGGSGSSGSSSNVTPGYFETLIKVPVASMYGPPYSYESKHNKIYGAETKHLYFKFSKNNTGTMHEKMFGFFSDDIYRNISNIIEITHPDGSIVETKIIDPYHDSRASIPFKSYYSSEKIYQSGFKMDISNFSEGRYRYRVAFQYYHIDQDIFSDNDRKWYTYWSSPETFYIENNRPNIVASSTYVTSSQIINFKINIDQVSYLSSKMGYKWYYKRSGSTTWTAVHSVDGGTTYSMNKLIKVYDDYDITFKCEINPGNYTSVIGTTILTKLVKVRVPSTGGGKKHDIEM